MEIRRHMHFLPAVHAADRTHAHLGLFHIRSASTRKYTDTQDIRIDCNLHLLPFSRFCILRDARTISSTPSAESRSNV